MQERSRVLNGSINLEGGSRRGSLPVSPLSPCRSPAGPGQRPESDSRSQQLPPVRRWLGRSVHTPHPVHPARAGPATRCGSRWAALGQRCSRYRYRRCRSDRRPQLDPNGFGLGMAEYEQGASLVHSCSLSLRLSARTFRSPDPRATRVPVRSGSSSPLGQIRHLLPQTARACPAGRRGSR